jgi:hypothetical protein
MKRILLGATLPVGRRSLVLNGSSLYDDLPIGDYLI